MSSGRGGGGSAVEIPASTKKVVQDLKEVVGYSEEEIYAMLKECDMDPNETAQRLLNQGDPFHEVKRKRDKKKESGGAKESQDMRGRLGSGGYPRGGGRSGGGRGGSLPRYGSQGSQEHGGGRGRPYGRENGIHPGSRSSSTVSNSSPAFGQTRPSGTALSSTPSSTAAQPPAVPVQTPTASSGSSGGSAANGSSGYVRPAPGPQGAWASGHGTMADLLKARAAPPSSTSSSQVPSSSPSIPAAVAPSYPAAAAPVSSSEASEFYSSSTDPVLDTFVDSVPAGSQNAIGAVGNQRLIGDRFVSSPPAELSLDSSAASSSTQTSAVPAAVGSGETEVEEVEARAASPAAASTPASSSQDTSLEEADVSVEVGNSQAHESKSVLGGSQFDGRPLYGSPQQPVGTQKVVGSGGLEWKAKASGHGSLGASSDGGSQGLDAVNPTSIAQAYQSLSIQDDEPVIIPTHLRVPEADRSHLSFGSFGADFGTGHGTSFGFAEVQDNKKHAETIAVEENSIEMAPPSSVETQVEIVQSYGLQQVATPVENLSASVEAPSVVHPAPVIPAQEQPTKPDPVVQQTPYFLGVSNYSGFGLMPQMPAGQYAYEQTESLPQDVSRIPSMMPTYDPTTSYYTSAFRGADADRLYPPYVATNTASKYSGNVGLVAAPSLLSSQEGGNPMLASAAPSVSAAQSSQPGSNVQTTQVMPQQALPMHYSQPPSGHFGSYMSYQYMPANYPYLQPPYPHHIYNSNSTSYAQPPAGSTYTPPAASSYPAGGAAGVKFPMPQYKPGAAAGSGPNSALGMGYGGYTTTPSGYASSPAVTAGNASGYDDVNTSHYKDSTLYIPSQQQGDSSTVWIQAAMPREMGPSGTMQTSSYYNLAGQGQHSGYAHSQQPAHGHGHPNAAYALYHPSQTGLASSHQILQQPQNMGGGGGNSQAGGYQQQPQRTQQTWNNSNY